MKKPIKPKKPSKNDVAPSNIINVRKLLVSNSNKFLLIDHDSHPMVFTSLEGEVDSIPIRKESGLSLAPYCSDNMERLGLNFNFERLKYSDYKLIEKDCNILVDFEVEHNYCRDGYYHYSVVSYNSIDSEYNSKLDAYNKRFDAYDKQLEEYEIESKKYEEYKKSEKKKKLELELKKLQ